jgi:hypothetical protein
MILAPTEILSLQLKTRPGDAALPAERPGNTASNGLEMLHRGIAAEIDSADTPDKRYWTAYDHFMVEREARALRSAEIGPLCAKGVAALRKWLP